MNREIKPTSVTYVRVPTIDGTVEKFPVSRHVLSVSPHVKTFSQRTSFRKRSTSLVLSVCLAASAIAIPNGHIGSTLSYFRDVETSIGNLFRAGFLDFLVADGTYARTITATTTPIIIPMMTPEAGSFPAMYRVTAEQTGGVTALCNALNAVATTSPFIYSGTLLALNTTPTTTTGTWNLGLTLATTTGLTNGDICNADLIYRGWHPTAAENTGFTDEERVHLVITYQATASVFDIVLNEFLPNPDETANGLNFGKDSDNMPLGEWVELYNNGDLPQNISGWSIQDASGGVGNTHAIISAANTFPATTTIPAHGWLVVYTNKQTLNNTGDELHLFTGGGIEVDSYAYNDPSDFCEQDPTPGATNATTTPPSGIPGTNCINNAVAPNKSYARIPDGTGAWVDPIPTPGAPNIPDLEPEPELPAPEVLGAEDAATTTEPTSEAPAPTSSGSASAPAPAPEPAPAAEEPADETAGTPAEETTTAEEPVASDEPEAPPAEPANEQAQEPSPEETPADTAAPEEEQPANDPPEETAEQTEQQPATEPEPAPSAEPPAPVEPESPPPPPSDAPSGEN